MTGAAPTPPAPAEVAAITAAIEVLWSGATVVVEPSAGSGPETPAWRFSGRWWTAPVVIRRERPW